MHPSPARALSAPTTLSQATASSGRNRLTRVVLVLLAGVVLVAAANYVYWTEPNQSQSAASSPATSCRWSR